MSYARLLPVCLLLCYASLPAQTYGQTLFSYFDENGIRVLTNIPPKGQFARQWTTAQPGTPPAQSEPLTASKKSSPYDAIIEKYSVQYELDPALIRSMIQTESGFNEKAVSPKGAGGLMQLMPATAARVGVRNLFDPEQNIRGGAQHMRNLLDTFNNDLPLSLAAYNAGENLVQRLGRVPNIRETHDYVRKVTRLYGKEEMQPEAGNVQPRTIMFKYTDDQGVLHMTNIPPVVRSELESVVESDQ